MASGKFYAGFSAVLLTHWGRATHICVSKLTTIGPDNGLSPDRRQAIIWTNAGTLLIVPLWTNFSEIGIGIQTFPAKKMHLKISSAKLRLFCLAFNVLQDMFYWSSNGVVFLDIGMWDIRCKMIKRNTRHRMNMSIFCELVWEILSKRILISFDKWRVVEAVL